jgi:hypothetical protein
MMKTSCFVCFLPVIFVRRSHETTREASEVFLYVVGVVGTRHQCRKTCLPSVVFYPVETAEKQERGARERQRETMTDDDVREASSFIHRLFHTRGSTYR